MDLNKALEELKKFFGSPEFAAKLAEIKEKFSSPEERKKIEDAVRGFAPGVADTIGNIAGKLFGDK